MVYYTMVCYTNLICSCTIDMGVNYNELRSKLSNIPWNTEREDGSSLQT
jgi:hypothetical protein